MTTVIQHSQHFMTHVTRSWGVPQIFWNPLNCNGLHVIIQMKNHEGSKSIKRWTSIHESTRDPIPTRTPWPLAIPGYSRRLGFRPPNVEGLSKERDLLKTIQPCGTEPPGPDGGLPGLLIVAYLDFIYFNPWALCAGFFVEDGVVFHDFTEANLLVAHKLSLDGIQDLLSHARQHDTETRQKRVGHSVEAALFHHLLKA